MSAVPRSNEQRLRAALLWVGDAAAAAGRSAGELFGLEGVRADSPEIVIVAPAGSGLTASSSTAVPIARQRTILETNGRRWHDDAVN
jgi:hypothetical protein